MASYGLNTFSGRRVDLADPSAEDIAVEDIAAALSKICRFGAQAMTFYSVAQHAVLVADRVQELHGDRAELVAWALHHDSAEAYTCDLPRPLKRLLKDRQDPSQYHLVARRLDDVIAQKLGLQIPPEDSEEEAIIDEADNWTLHREAKVLLRNGTDELGGKRDLSTTEIDKLAALPEPLAPREAQQAFLDRHERLGLVPR